MNEPVAAQSPVAAERRIALYFLTLYLSGGAATTFVGIWFAGKGLSADQIGYVNSVPILILLALNLAVGRLADRASDWRQIIVLGSVASAIVPFGLFFVHGFWGILIVWSLTMITQATVTPVADAAAMRVTRRNGTDFGALRAWGTIGFLCAIFVTGYLVQWFGPTAFLPWFVGLGVLRGAAALALPKLRAPEGAAVVKGASKLRDVLKPWFLLPLFGWSMVFATHLALNGFQSLLWSREGIAPDVIGILISLGALSEAAMFFAFRRFSGKFGARKLILLSSVVTVARWIAMAYSPSVPFLVALQLLHSVTFALGFLGCMNFIANWTSEDIAAEAQGFFTMLQQGTAVIAVAGFGWLAGDYGAKAYLASAAFAAVGATLVYLSIRLQPPKEQGA